MLIPFLPYLDQHAQHYEQYFNDVYESYGQTSPGLYLIILAAIGFWQMRKQVTLWFAHRADVGCCVCCTIRC